MAILYLDGKRMKNLITASANWLIANEQVLNDQNVFPVPDGDTGTNMGSTLRSIIEAIRKNKMDWHLPSVAEKMAGAALLGARGNSGVILSMIFQGFSEGIANKKRMNSMDIAFALKKAYEKAYNAVSKPVEGTILTVIRDGADEAIKIARKEPDITTMLEGMLAACRKSLANTPNLLPVLKEAGVVDAGAMGFVYIIEGILMHMKGHRIPETAAADSYRDLPAPGKTKVFSVDYGYCTEFLIHPTALNAPVTTEDLRTTLEGLGDSIVIAGAEDFIKVHIHSKHPGNIMEECLQYGVLTGIKIENMDDQHARLEQKEFEALKDAAFIAVALGEGVKRIFESLGCDYVITGGQTMNPSVQDIVHAINAIQSKHTILLPNNSNVIFSAEQAAALFPDREVHVLKTKSIPEGFSALLAYNSEADFSENLRNMEKAVKKTKSGEVTVASRETTVNGDAIKTGDRIALTGGKILGRYDTDYEALVALIESMAETSDEILSLFYSEEIDETAATEIEQKLKEKFSQFEIEAHHGGQPYYSFIVSIG